MVFILKLEQFTQEACIGLREYRGVIGEPIEYGDGPSVSKVHSALENDFEVATARSYDEQVTENMWIARAAQDGIDRRVREGVRITRQRASQFGAIKRLAFS